MRRQNEAGREISTIPDPPAARCGDWGMTRTRAQRLSDAAKKAARMRQRRAQANPTRLTGKCQRLLLVYITDHYRLHRCGPTWNEMRRFLGHKSLTHVGDVLNRLEKCGLIERCNMRRGVRPTTVLREMRGSAARAA
jgi:hypothetical protein